MKPGRVKKWVWVDWFTHLFLTMPRQKKKNAAAVALGRRGARKGGLARAASMTAEERSESARQAVAARWERYRKEINPR